jgi:2-polyprenyl-3-methyl-5-hydroxy-6-metoxy-1,4-benzoquinol methylase
MINKKEQELIATLYAHLKGKRGKGGEQFYPYLPLLKKLSEMDFSPPDPVIAEQPKAKVKAKKPAPAPKKPEPIRTPKEEFEELKRLLHTPEWPEAVEASLICNKASEEDKFSRANGIIDILITRDVEGKKFLDFGCGEGHVAYKVAEKNASFSLGYDPKQSPNWKNFKAELPFDFTTELEIVKKNAPYDIILIYDVLDHMSSNQIKLLGIVKNFLSPEGVVYVRTHPWCSRHATHSYHDINKAYIHLIFSEEELKEMGYPTDANNPKVIHPLKEYGKWFKEAGFKVNGSASILREPVENFFKENDLVKKRMASYWMESHESSLRGGGFPQFQVEQQFLDYILTK